MSELSALQNSFLQYLLDGESSIVGHIQSTPERSARQRLNIYASGYRLRLKEAMMTDFEQLHHYMGDDFFHQLMDRYIDKYPSNQTSLRYFSQNITDLLSTDEVFSKHPELCEIARIEEAFNSSFDAANCTPKDASLLAELAPESWPALVLQFHSSVQVLQCQFNTLQIWQALSQDQVPPMLESDNTHWLIWRKGLISRYRAIPNAEADLLTAAMTGANFSHLCETLLKYFSEEQTPMQAITYLQNWLNEQMVCQITDGAL